jgi:hypothetical protein
MQKPGGKQVRESSWSQTELLLLMQAVDRNGRDCVAVSRDVGSKTRQQCKGRAFAEIAAGRMQEPGGKQIRELWSKAELIKLIAAVDRYGRDWVSVSREVGSKTKMQCIHKICSEVAAGRMQEPVGKRMRDLWSPTELIQLKAAVDRHGRDWVSVSHDVGSKTSQQCQHKLSDEVKAGRWRIAP